MSKDSCVGKAPKFAKGKMCYDLCVNRPELNVSQITELMQVEYPRHTEAATRMMLHRYGLKVTKREYTKNPNTTYRGKPAPEVTMPKQIHRAAVHGYSGRSRTLPGYYEL